MKKNIILVLFAWLLINADIEFHQVAWGTGTWFGEFSLSWAVLFFAMVMVSLGLFSFAAAFAYNPSFFSRIVDGAVQFRRKLVRARWLLWLVVFLFPFLFFQLTYWGIVFQKPYIRLLMWGIVALWMAFLSTEEKQLVGWRAFLTSVILTSSLFSVAASLRLANDYPFSQGWSEGNRLWDYSIMFGSDRYDFPAEQGIPVFLDSGRQLIGGLIFLVPGIGIFAARIWVGLIQILPYLLLGAVLFRFEHNQKMHWILLLVWSFLFLKQGPIHPPLVISAALVALAWRSPLWFAIPLVIISGYFAQSSRFTWVFAPGLWIGMLEFTSSSIMDLKHRRTQWVRGIVLATSGIVGGFLLPKLMPLFNIVTPPPAEVDNAVVAVTEQVVSSGLTLDQIIYSVTQQPLLWYRLLPNSTYGNGILLGLAYAVLPLIVLLIWLLVNNKWVLNTWQKLFILGPLAAFLAVGLIASTKIGGGGDLHNLDMFLIGLLFVAAAAWFNGGREWVLDPSKIPDGMKFVLVFSLVNSSLAPLQAMRTFTYEGDLERLMILTDKENPKSLDILPAQAVIDFSLKEIQAEVDAARADGEVLFMDQRQLLTFGFITNVPLVPEYDKKLLMDEAMAADAGYFAPFYADLSSKRFALIVSEILREPVRDSSYQFGEENNAWVEWVARPILCYYEPRSTLKDVGVQLLVPKQEDTSHCDQFLP